MLIAGGANSSVLGTSEICALIMDPDRDGMDDNWLFVARRNYPPPMQLHRVALRPGLQDAVLADELLQFQTVIPHPDGRLLAVLDNYGILLVVEVESMRVLTQAWLREPPSRIPEEVRKAIVADGLEKILGELKNHRPAEELERYRKESARHFLPRESIRVGVFSPDGRWLFCGTNFGLRGLDWGDVVRCRDEDPVPVRVAAEAEPVFVEHGGQRVLEQRYVYGIVYDAVRQRVLFCGLEGKISFLGLSDGRAGKLLTVPGGLSLIPLALVPDRSALVATARRFEFESNKRLPFRFQIWSYPALCRAAGLEH